MCTVIFVFKYINTLILIITSNGGGGAARFIILLFSLFSRPRAGWPPCKVVFRVGNQHTECENEEVLYLQPMILPKHFDISSPD